MGQLNSVIIPAVYKDIITEDDRIFPHVKISVTQKYHYSGNEHHYSLVKRKIHGTIVITPSDLYLFRHRSIALHVKLDDERWNDKKILATYDNDNHTLDFTVDIKAFKEEIKQSIFSPPPRFESGSLFLSCAVSLPHTIIDILCRHPPSSSSSLSPSYSSSTIPVVNHQVIEATN